MVRVFDKSCVVVGEVEVPLVTPGRAMALLARLR